MAFLAKCKKTGLARFAEELGIEITHDDRVIDICRKIKTCPDYEEEFAKGQLEIIAQEREAEAEIARIEREAEAASGGPARLPACPMASGPS
ncbi:hypothetical protein AVEN_72041-1 [Araneus ventricosus]|uniref:Uncharacterized protein n=1 Tax=Araneus ventricosus TaxID=182803 RepID=A0A4Y2KIU7_ARAVE|nr:hypothetical protein AVEN_72041-1 [Araneus ventricosus]